MMGMFSPGTGNPAGAGLDGDGSTYTAPSRAANLSWKLRAMNKFN